MSFHSNSAKYMAFISVNVMAPLFEFLRQTVCCQLQGISELCSRNYKFLAVSAIAGSRTGRNAVLVGGLDAIGVEWPILYDTTGRFRNAVRYPKKFILARTQASTSTLSSATETQISFSSSLPFWDSPPIWTASISSPGRDDVSAGPKVPK